MVRAIPPGDLCDTAAGGRVGEGAGGGAMVHRGAAQGEASHNARPRLEPMARDHPGAIDGTNREMPSGGAAQSRGGAIGECGTPLSTRLIWSGKQTQERFCTSMQMT